MIIVPKKGKKIIEGPAGREKHFFAKRNTGGQKETSVGGVTQGSAVGSGACLGSLRTDRCSDIQREGRGHRFRSTAGVFVSRRGRPCANSPGAHTTRKRNARCLPLSKRSGGRAA